VITMRVPPAYLPGSPADATTTPAGRAPTGKGLLAHRAPGSRAGLQGDLGIIVDDWVLTGRLSRRIFRRK
jgi:hypothetical protein